MPDRTELAEGLMTVQPHGDGWYLVQIGRARGTKRFNLSAGEAAELIRQLQTLLPATDPCPRG